VARTDHGVQRLVHHLAKPEEDSGPGVRHIRRKAAAAKLAGMTSRINTMLSIPMLYCMVAQQNGGL
jgi:hypothetical protein